MESQTLVSQEQRRTHPTPTEVSAMISLVQWTELLGRYGTQRVEFVIDRKEGLWQIYHGETLHKTKPHGEGYFTTSNPKGPLFDHLYISMFDTGTPVKLVSLNTSIAELKLTADVFLIQITGCVRESQNSY